MEERQPRRGGLVGPLLLIGLGATFLLNNLGMLEWGVWLTLLQLWPVLLIAIGLELLIGRRSTWGSLIAVALIILVFVGALALSLNREATRGRIIDERIAQSLEGASEARVVIQVDAGKLILKAASESAFLIEGNVRTTSGPKITHSYQVLGKRGVYTLSTEKGQDNLYLMRGDIERSWDLALNPQLPLELEVALAVGEADLDLSKLRLSALKVSMAVGRTHVTLPAEGKLKADLGGAIGEIEIIVPKGMAVRVDSGVALGTTTAPTGYTHSERVYTSPGYANAESRMDIKVGLAIGRVIIREE